VNRFTINNPFLIKILVFLLLLLFGCSGKNDLKQDSGSYTYPEKQKKTIHPKLDLIEEIYDNMDYDRVINKYANKVPPGMSISRFKYYVIFSELDENTTYNLIDKDIRHTVDAMSYNYVSELPDSITPVFLFKEYDSYKDFSVQTFGLDEKDLSPFGFYKISKNIIVIRYVSWKGSTAHEITHSLIQYDFPEIPSWFNEGLAALHEKYIYKEGQMMGDFSWRIVALRRAFRENNYTYLNTLMETNDDEFYSTRTSFYYAQARYLLMYVQSKGLLDNYYKLFRSTYDEDKTGIMQLEKILNKPLPEIDEEFVEYVNSFTQDL
jgi:hypothetical protein